MKFGWYLDRLAKMRPAEIFKRSCEHAGIYWSRLKYADGSKWPYERFAQHDDNLIFKALPNVPTCEDPKQYFIYNYAVDLTNSIEWYGANDTNLHWPDFHYSKINYRPGNPYGDVRINWELNRLQFLAGLARDNEKLAINILSDWLAKNRYVHGPAYIASMEVALRWISIYRAVCLFKQPLEKAMSRRLAGHAIAAGRFIESRLSTHSSAGNHLIVEAVGLFWIGKALENSRFGSRWIQCGRAILHEQILKQIHPDGSNKEQSFWYLGFVLDAIFHYFLLENRNNIPAEVWTRVGKIVTFIDDLILTDGNFPDYGDRDDGFVLRPCCNYKQSPFMVLRDVGRILFNGSQSSGSDDHRVNTYLPSWAKTTMDSGAVPAYDVAALRPHKNAPRMKTYDHGGMTLMEWGKGRLLFRHSCLGLENMFGHGHADALAIMFWWDDVPVLIDLGSGQYNGDQHIRNYFRSTIAHNTVEIDGRNQAQILGPFMWRESYDTNLEYASKSPHFSIKARHNGYVETCSTWHAREIHWRESTQLEIIDAFQGPGGLPLRGALHFADCKAVQHSENTIFADFGKFVFSVMLPSKFSLKVYHGSQSPFMGWRSTIYGAWQPIYSIVYSHLLGKNDSYKMTIRIEKKESQN